MLIELLQPTGPDLARRWLAALLLVPREDRQGVVVSVEDRITSMYANADGIASNEADEPREVDVVHPPVQHDGYVEEVRTTYSAPDKAPVDLPAHANPKPLGKAVNVKAGQARKAGKAG